MTRTALHVVPPETDLHIETPLPASCPLPPDRGHFMDPLWKSYFAARREWDLTHPDAITWRKIEDARNAALERLENERTERADRVTRLDSAGVPLADRVRGQVIRGELDDTACFAALKTFFDTGTKSWLVLAGPVGCGKSVAAAAAIARYGGVWISAVQLGRVFLANFGDEAKEQERIRTAPMLVIDDLGMERDAAHVATVLVELLDARKSANRRPTIVTTNLARPALLARYPGERLASRLAEQAEYHADDGPDLRRAKA